MKRKKLIKTITDAGCVLARHGDRHDLYKKPENRLPLFGVIS
jgi:predicted RNA binding protein YcfA (HicA-like mRNA interferase family)